MMIAYNNRRRRPRIVPIDPTPPPGPLEGFELGVFRTFLRYHAALLQYAGESNRDQWMQMLAQAASATIAAYDKQRGVTDGSEALPGEVGEVIEVQNAPSLILTPGDWDVHSSIAQSGVTIALPTRRVNITQATTIDAPINGIMWARRAR